MTDDRFKTFNHLLEAVSWLVVNPNCRAVRAKNGVTVRFTFNYNFQPLLIDDNGYPIERMDRLAPFVTINDEHGVIPEKEKEFEGSHARQMVGQHILELFEDLKSHRRDHVACFLRRLDELIDERIAATVVAQMGAAGDGYHVWNDTGYRLKPRGEK